MSSLHFGFIDRREFASPLSPKFLGDMYYFVIQFIFSPLTVLKSAFMAYAGDSKCNSQRTELFVGWVLGRFSRGFRKLNRYFCKMNGAPRLAKMTAQLTIGKLANLRLHAIEINRVYSVPPQLCCMFLEVFRHEVIAPYLGCGWTDEVGTRPGPQKVAGHDSGHTIITQRGGGDTC